MSFITNANCKSLLSDIDLGKLGCVPTDDLYPRNLGIFSAHEKHWLAAAAMLFGDLQDFLQYAYRKRSPSADDLSLVYAAKAPAFHGQLQCACLTADYRNFLIPDQVKVRGEAAVAEFRRWFQENKSLFDQDQDRFLARMSMRFRLQNTAGLKELMANNSGVARQANPKLEALCEEIDELIDEAEAIRHGGDRKAAVIRMMGHRAHLSHEDAYVTRVLSEWRALKARIKALLIVYFRVTLNPELTFDGRLLEQLGFSPCPACHDESLLHDDVIWDDIPF